MPRNCEVVEMWREGKVGCALHLQTNGRDLYSYSLLIGYTDEKGEKVTIDYTKKHFVSKTTSRHVGYAKKLSDKVVEPTQKMYR